MATDYYVFDPESSNIPFFQNDLFVIELSPLSMFLWVNISF